MFLADVKCSQATWQTVPSSRADSTKASVFKEELLVRISPAATLLCQSRPDSSYFTCTPWIYLLILIQKPCRLFSPTHRNICRRRWHGKGRAPRCSISSKWEAFESLNGRWIDQRFWRFRCACFWQEQQSADWVGYYVARL